jgi:uncharacterized protein YfbU (UPF0304 family)
MKKITIFLMILVTATSFCYGNTKPKAGYLSLNSISLIVKNRTLLSKQPDKKGFSIEFVDIGEKVNAIGVFGDWVEIKKNTNSTGWIKTKYTQIDPEFENPKQFLNTIAKSKYLIHLEKIETKIMDLTPYSTDEISDIYKDFINISDQQWKEDRKKLFISGLQKKIDSLPENARVAILNLYELIIKVDPQNTEYALKHDKQKSENTKIEIQELEEYVRSIPKSETETNLNIYRKLLKLAPKNETYKNKVTYYSKIQNKKDSAKRQYNEEQSRISDIELMSWSWTQRNSYAFANGLITMGKPPALPGRLPKFDIYWNIDKAS